MATTTTPIRRFWLIATPLRRRRLRRLGIACCVFAAVVIGLCLFATRVDVLAYHCWYHPGPYGSSLSNADLEIPVSDYVVHDLIGRKDCVWIPQSPSGLPVFYWR